jgi:hypothetical protein
VGNSGQTFERWAATTSDGAYPRLEGRGIAPVQSIIEYIQDEPRAEVLLIPPDDVQYSA